MPSLSKAYSGMKKMGHMMAKGGECSACGGGNCMYAEGGSAPQPSPSPDNSSLPDSTNSQEKRKQIADSFKNVFAEGGEVKGVHKTAYDHERPQDKVEKSLAGESMAGSHVRDANHYADMHGDKMGSGKKFGEIMGKAKGEHEKVLGQMKAMPKPKLEGLASGGRVGDDGLVKLSGADRSPVDRNKHSKGVHNSWMDQGRSHAGTAARLGLTVESKMSHTDKLAELKSMPNPKLKGLAEGGSVDDAPDMDGGEDNEMLEQCCGELIKGFETKNKKDILDSIRAIVLSIKG